MFRYIPKPNRKQHKTPKTDVKNKVYPIIVVDASSSDAALQGFHTFRSSCRMYSPLIILQILLHWPRKGISILMIKLCKVQLARHVKTLLRLEGQGIITFPESDKERLRDLLGCAERI